MNYDYIRLQARRYQSGRYDKDDCLCKLGRAAEIFSYEELSRMHGGKLTSAMRSRVLYWLRQNANQLDLTVEN